MHGSLSDSSSHYSECCNPLVICTVLTSESWKAHSKHCNELSNKESCYVHPLFWYEQYTTVLPIILANSLFDSINGWKMASTISRNLLFTTNGSTYFLIYRSFRDYLWNNQKRKPKLLLREGVERDRKRKREKEWYFGYFVNFDFFS